MLRFFARQGVTGGWRPATRNVLGPLTASFSPNAAPGTLIANLTGTPSSGTPSFAPNDGRVVVAGDPVGGWKLVVGPVVATIGVILGTISAPGAIGTLIAITVSAVPANVLTDELFGNSYVTDELFGNSYVTAS